MNSFRERCIELRKQDKSIIEIMRITGKPKTSIYKHIKDIPLSDKRVEQYRIASGKRIRKFAMARKGKSARAFIPFQKWQPEKISLVAHLLFDGSIDPRNGCAYNNRSLVLLQHVEEQMRSVYEFEPARYQNPLTGVRRITYHNVALGAYIKDKSGELLQCIQQLSVNSKRIFLRAFFDDEGCMDYRISENRRSIRGYQKDVRILKLVRTLLRDIGIESKVVMPNEVVIVGKENLIKFEQEINFSQGLYVNGDRSNSRWGKHIEKRELLKMAIESFKN